MPISGYFDVIFAAGGDLATVPDASQPDGSVNYTDGYGADYSLPNTNPGFRNPERYKMNQLFNDITSAIQQYQQHGTPPFITSAMNGGSPFSYSLYDRVLYSGVVYISNTNSNTDTPPSSKWTVDPFASVALKANIASPTFTGTPAAPTAANGTNTTQLATTAFAYGALSTAAGGYVKLPNGLIIQWGLVSLSYTTSEQSTTVTFPLTFPTALLSVAEMFRNSACISADHAISAVTAPNMTVKYKAASPSTAGFYYIAIGY